MDDLIKTSRDNAEAFAQRAILTPLHRLHEEVDRLFHDYAPKVRVTMPWRGSVNGKHPIPIDAMLTDSHLDICADVPGMALDDIDITLSGQRLILRGHREEILHDSDAEILHQECDSGAFYRELDLPIEPDEAKIEATLQQGVLRILIPKSKATKKQERKISVKKD
ncbi:Hsp20/alpha crystallin family protein [Kordiimonas lipolytica]|uniref:Hsp20/alpha crystallin family protein n=1 Tax=Kordiimonas lipolytica TaxID=1662421 RepID=A0ABV8U6N0_9PROT|nr:Hsp20/alpha crystallin family protein [Kordiimonas lipolytica]